MSQHDFNIANATAPAFRLDLNNALAALATLSSDVAEPSTTFANMLWYDTANNMLYMRNEADTAWIELFTLDQTGNTAAAAVGGTLGDIEALTPTGGAIMYWNGSTWVALAVGAANQALRSNGSIPYWGDVVVTAGAGQLQGTGYNSTDGTWIAGNLSTVFTGALGTYCLALNVNYNNTVLPGANIGGGSLYYSTAAGESSGYGPAGTWKCMGYTREYTVTNTALKTTLYMRVA